jgi:regulator of sigma E protease
MLTTLILFIVILGVLVFVHEFGHFYTAKKLGVKSDEFGFGFPPRMFGWKKINGKRKFFWGNGEVESEDTIYSLNWIPIGGFVKIKGEDGEDKSDKDSFASQKIWKRTAILSAGVTMNVVLCMILLMFAFGLGAPQVIDGTNQASKVTDEKIQILSILNETPASEAGLVMGDVIVSLNDKTFSEVQAVIDYLGDYEGQNVTVNISRLGEAKTFEIAPVILEQTGTAGFGIGLAKTGIVSYPWYQAIWLGIKGTFLMFIQIIVAFYTVIKNAIIHQPIGVDVAGPVGIAVLTGQVARMGIVYLLQFTALLSLNLAIINFLPIPALDGGRVLFLIIEKIRGKAANEKVEQVVHTAGFMLLMVLIVVVTGKDIWNYKDSIFDLWQRIIS